MDQRFTDLKLISEDATASLFEAVEGTTQAAVRLLRFKGTGDEREGLKQLFRAMEKLDHRGIEAVVAVEDGGEVLEIALLPPKGLRLNELLAEGPLTVDEFEQVATGLLNAVATVHDMGLVHGAIRPGVVWIDRTDKKKWGVRLHGFGLGFGDGGDGSRAAVEAYRCAAPEQWEGAGAHRRSDVWAVGCVLYEALSGRSAFDGKTLKELRSKHLKHDVMDLGKLAPQVPKWVSACVMRLMALVPEERPRKGAVALEIFLKGAEEEVNPTMNAPAASGTVTGSAPAAGATSTAVPVPAAAQVMPQWTQSIPAQAPPPPRQPLSATHMIASRPSPTPPAKGRTGPITRSVSSAAAMKASPPVPWMPIGIGAGVVIVGLFFLLSGGGDPADEGATQAKVAQAKAAPTENLPPPPKEVVPLPVTDSPMVVAMMELAPGLLVVDGKREAGMASLPLPKGRPITPAAPTLYLHCRADSGVRGYGKGRGVMMALNGNGPVAEWGDMGQMAGENPMTTIPWSLTQRRVIRSVLEPSAGFPLKGPRSFIQFTGDGDVPAAMVLTGKGEFPSRPLSAEGLSGLHYFAIFYTTAKDQDQILSMITAKNVAIELGLRPVEGGGLEFYASSRDPRPNVKGDRGNREFALGGVDLSVPTMISFMWQGESPTSSLKLLNAKGERAEVDDGRLLNPHGGLNELSLGARPQFAWKTKDNRRDTFRGGVAELMVYGRALGPNEQEKVEQQLTNYYFP